MKETRRLLNGLVACAVALAMVSTLAAQTATQRGAKVVRIKGGARYKVGNNDWQQLKVGDVVKPGTVIQSAANSRVDFVLGDTSFPAARPASSDMVSFQPSAEQDIVRIWENTLVSVDTLTETQTGADVVTETQIDLKAGRITGTVKKMSAGSKYEVKIPNGVAGIRGTVYDISAEGVIKVFSGSVVLAYVGPNGSVVTQVVHGLQQFDARTGVLSSLGDPDKTGMGRIINQMRTGLSAIPGAGVPIQPVQYIQTTPSGFVSPH